MRALLVLPVVLAACDTAEPEPAALAGTITSGGEAGEVVQGTGFASELGGKIALVIFPRESVTCEQAGDELGKGDTQSDPSVVQEAGKCMVSVVAEYEDGFSVTAGTLFDATLSVSCAMGEGAWEFREKDRYNEAGYFYTGAWWQGSPEEFDLTVEGDEDAGYTISLAMETYTGQFIYDLEETDPDPGEGAVSGTASAASCSELQVLL